MASCGAAGPATWVYSVAHPLRLDYVGLKKRLDGVSAPKKKAAKAAFVEQIADPSATMARLADRVRVVLVEARCAFG